MARIEPAGLPAVRLEPLRRLRRRETLCDEDMAAAHRANLLDPAAPAPSVETLLHAFLPHRYIDHTHANAVLALTDQPDGAALCREVFGESVAVAPYIMPGFALARRAAELFEERPDCEGLILLNHGVFTFGGTARDSYERMIRLASLAEARLAAAPAKVFAGAALPKRPAGPEAVAPILRGLLARPPAGPDGEPARFLLAFRGGARIRRFVDGAEVSRYGLAGPVTPDHALRVKPWPVLLPPADADRLDGFARGAEAAIRKFEADYLAYFERGNARAGGSRTALDPAPRVLLAPRHRPLRRRPGREGRRGRRRSRRGRHGGGRRRRAHRAVPEPRRGRTCSTSNTGRSNRRSWAEPRRRRRSPAGWPW